MRPGAEECRVRVEWGGVEYPAVLDPVWTSTASLAKDRTFAVSGVVESGRFVVAGGRSCLAGKCTPLFSTEIYDPATASWAQGPELGVEHDGGGSAYVPGFGLMTVGSESKDPAIAAQVERYREDLGAWEPLFSMSEGRQEPILELTADLKSVVVFGGLNPDTNLPLGTIEVFDTATQSWSPGGLLNKARYLATATRLPDGKILIAGGTNCGNCGPIADAELYDPASQTSAALPDLNVAHFAHSAALLQIQGKPRVLIAGGGVSSCELYDPETKTWTLTGEMLTNRVYGGSTLLADGTFLLAGGVLVPTFEPSFLSERFDPVSQTWKGAGDTASAHGVPAFGLLAGGRFVLAGGTKNNFLSGTETVAGVDVFQLQAQAQACKEGGECASGF